ncbi:MAG: Cell division protein FtsI [Peptidoglycan synthetase] [uncultured Chthoniobacterales bacterium]|uniref:Cell division protein FtsI [Peptidoglycan synthetase] n=1 Tax=uncultured Chthoniobacterales bacterium TaxID=1836801 RepID=A0A6J4ID94_9BACT|nr:MAG: Cell division protein FtsI [Peptidoglycan synthetase] [uncultured Chthoniobacterales bacterium]
MRPGACARFLRQTQDRLFTVLAVQDDHARENRPGEFTKPETLLSVYPLVKRLLIIIAAGMCAASVLAQESSSPSPAPAAGSEEEIIPTFETQKLARTYILNIPAPRGQIVDRNGLPLAQNKLSYNLAINYPTPLEFSDQQAISFARERIQAAEKLLGRALNVSDDLILRHYRNRGILPFDIAQNLTEEQHDKLKAKLPQAMTLRALYMRVYPQGRLAGHIIGYTGKTGRNPDGVIENNEVLWPESEGREGLEFTFNSMLTGKPGEYKITFDKDGRKTSEKIVTPPVPGYTVVTTLDSKLQELAEKTLEAKAKRGAIVVVEPDTGDILAMASWPTFNPNAFIPSISAEKFKELQDDPDIPLLPRAFRSAYPPGSVFKVPVGIAALESGTVGASDEYQCTPAIQVGNVTFNNWKKVDRGFQNFVQAFTESCDTWFYQVGIKMGAAPIIDWSAQMGLGAKCGIPLRGEVEGRIPTDEYMKAAHGRRILNGDVANMSIGQGDIETTPLQMAQAMAIVANGGTLYQTRLVQQVQTLDNEIITAYQVRAKRTLNMSPSTLEQLREAMVDVVYAPNGTAHQAAVPNIEVAGKTGTAQWGPKKKERTAAWFTGYVPSVQPQFAFAAVYEGAVGADVHGGSHAAPMIGAVFKEVYKGVDTGKKQQRKRPRPTEEPLRAERAVPVEPGFEEDRSN